MRWNQAVAGLAALLTVVFFAQAQQPKTAASRSAALRPAERAAPAAAEEDILESIEGPAEYYDERPWREPRAHRWHGRVYCGDPACADCCRSSCGLYVRPEFLLWSTQGMRLPPLVTTGDPTVTDPVAGIVSEDGSIPSNTTILFGNDEVNSQSRSGGRIVFGLFLDACRKWGAEGEYFALEDERTELQAESDGTTLLAIPHFDESNNGLPAVFHVSAGGSAGTPGSVLAFAETSFQGAGGRLVHTLPGWERCGRSCWNGCPIPVGGCVAMIVGYRFLRLDDAVGLRAESGADSSALVTVDQFDSRNEFHGVDVGTQIQFRRGCWSLDLLSKVAIGNTNRRVTIDGVTFQANQEQTPRGGILAQSTNIGLHESDEFTVVPEVGLSLGYQINPCWKFTCGYTLIYWCNVLRAGDQIDLHLNPELFPPRSAEPEEAGLWPQFPGVASDLWAQGLNLGMEARW
jgi:hypothetical protein